MQAHNRSNRRGRLVWLAPVLVVPALLATAAGCGGGGNTSTSTTTLSKAQVIAEGGKICRAAEAKVNQLPQLRTQHPFGPGTSAAEHRKARAFLRGYAANLEQAREGLQGLNAPSQDRALLEGYIHDTGDVVNELRAAAKAPPDKVEAMARKAFGMFAKASKQTAEYGFPKGVCGAGSSS
jgi:hypothetical protein